MAMQLRLHEVAARLNVSVKTARRYVELGVLPAVQYVPGGMVFVASEDVDALLRKGVQ